MEHDDVLEEVAANVRLLVREELEVQHRLGDHDRPAEGCAACLLRAG